MASIEETWACNYRKIFDNDENNDDLFALSDLEIQDGHPKTDRRLARGEESS